MPGRIVPESSLPGKNQSNKDSVYSVDDPKVLVAAQWQWQHTKEWRDYTCSQNARIEKAFQSGISHCKIHSGKEGKTPMELFFGDMVQYDAMTGNTRQIRRCGYDGIATKAKRYILMKITDLTSQHKRHKSFLKYKSAKGTLHPELTQAIQPRSEFCKRIAKSGAFGVFQFSAIFLYTFVIGFDVEFNGPQSTDSVRSAFEIIDHIFCSLFTVEIIVRLGAMGKRPTLKQAVAQTFEDAWFTFDFCLVVFMVFETWGMLLLEHLPGVDGSGSDLNKLGIMRILRLTRLSRLGRIAGLLKWFPEIMIMFKSILSAMRAVLVTLGLLGVLLYIFAIIFKGQCEESTLAHIFPTIPGSMWSLLTHGAFMDGVTVVTEEIYEEFPSLASLFLFFVFLSNLTVLNMLIGVICDVANNVGLKEKENKLSRSLASDLMEFAEFFDMNHDQSISVNEFDLLMGNPDVRLMLDRHGINAETLVALKDSIFEDTETDKTEESSQKGHFKPISFDEFTAVVLRFRGQEGHNATYMDVINLHKALSAEISCFWKDMKRLRQDVDMNKAHVAQNSARVAQNSARVAQNAARVAQNSARLGTDISNPGMGKTKSDKDLSDPDAVGTKIFQTFARALILKNNYPEINRQVRSAAVFRMAVTAHRFSKKTSGSKVLQELTDHNIAQELPEVSKGEEKENPVPTTIVSPAMATSSEHVHSPGTVSESASSSFVLPIASPNESAVPVPTRLCAGYSVAPRLPAPRFGTDEQHRTLESTGKEVNTTPASLPLRGTKEEVKLKASSSDEIEEMDVPQEFEVEERQRRTDGSLNLSYIATEFHELLKIHEVKRCMELLERLRASDMGNVVLPFHRNDFHECLRTESACENLV